MDSDPNFWPAGTVAVQAWRQAQGISKSLAERQAREGLLKHIGHGAYVRAGEEVAWTGALHAMQGQLKLPVHAGGQAALQLYRAGSVSNVALFARAGTRLPKWFWENAWGANIEYTATSLFEARADLGLAQRDCGGYAITLSAPERAIMEVLHRVCTSLSTMRAG